MDAMANGMPGMQCVALGTQSFLDPKKCALLDSLTVYMHDILFFSLEIILSIFYPVVLAFYTSSFQCISYCFA